jgi:hypothetical protein
MTGLTYAESIESHYVKKWREPVSTIRWDEGPTGELPSDFRILLMNRAPDMMAFTTRCMSQPADKDRVELHALCRPSDSKQSNLPEILTAIAHFHRTSHMLGLGHSVNFGKPWMPESGCTHGVISLPYLDGPDLEWMLEPRVRFLWLIPVTQTEIDFKNAHGMEALEERFEATQFDFLDPYRSSVV